MSHAILVTGATGSTGAEVCRQLADRGVPYRAASRHPDSPQGVRFDWQDDTTWAPALSGTTGIYLVPPGNDPDPARVVVPFLEKAVQLGARRVVLLGAIAVGPDDGGVGAVYRHLPRMFDEWAVLRPSWFMQNFTDRHQHAESIRRDAVIRTATGTGEVAFIDAADIAAVAVAALTADIAPNRHLRLTGPQSMSFADVAAIVSTVSGRTVRHENVSVDVLCTQVFGDMPSEFASMLADLDTRIGAGEWREVTDDVERVTGRTPTSFDAYARRRSDAFQATSGRGLPPGQESRGFMGERPDTTGLE